MWKRFPVKCPLFLPDFNETSRFSAVFRKKLKYILLKSVQWEPSCSLRMGGRTDGHTHDNSFRSFAKAPKNWTRGKTLRGCSEKLSPRSLFKLCQVYKRFVNCFWMTKLSLILVTRRERMVCYSDSFINWATVTCSTMERSVVKIMRREV